MTENKEIISQLKELNCKLTTLININLLMMQSQMLDSERWDESSIYKLVTDVFNHSLGKPRVTRTGAGQEKTNI